jgi:cytochrome P450
VGIHRVHGAYITRGARHADPYPFYATLRRDYPAYYSEGARCWVLSRHADVVAAMGQPLVFSSTAGNVINDSPEKVGRTVGSVDPPRHTRLRSVVNDAFNRKQVMGEAARIRAEVARLMDAAPNGPFDLVRAITAPLAGAVMSSLLGMDDIDPVRFKTLLDANLFRDPITRERTAEGVQAQADLLALVAEGVACKRGRPGPELISYLLAAETGGDGLSSDEVVWMARAVLGAGFESTSSLLANGTLALLDVAQRPGRHLGLGYGIHFCAGAVLARLVGHAYFSELAERLPALRRAGGEPLQWAHSPTFRSLTALPVTTLP